MPASSQQSVEVEHAPFLCRILFEAEERSEADLWLVNSCTVKSPSQSQMATVIADAKARGIGVVVAGCVPQGDKHSPDLQVPARRQRC